MLVISFSICAGHSGDPEEKLPRLRVGSEVYSNVTITTVTPTTILFNHSRGMASAKLQDLEPEMQRHFHFDPAKAREAQKSQTQANAEYRARALDLPRGSATGEAIEGLPLKAVTVVTAETKLRIRLQKDALALLLQKNFEQLEELAQTYRRSRQTFPDGSWLLGEVYGGLGSRNSEPDQAWLDRIALFEDWTNARPESVTARVALADEMVGYGWRARGTGYMRTVSSAAYRVFVIRAETGMLISQEAALLNTHCPFAPMPQLVAARGISGRLDKFFKPLADGIAKDPDFINYYVEGTTYELSRWHGMTEHSAEAILRRYADQLKGEEGDVLYARVVWHMQDSGMFSNAVEECGFGWDRVEKGFQTLEKRYPDALSVKSAHAFVGRICRRAGAGPVLDRQAGWQRGRLGLAIG